MPAGEVADENALTAVGTEASCWLKKYFCDAIKPAVCLSTLSTGLKGDREMRKVLACK